jgi:protein TonB
MSATQSPSKKLLLPIIVGVVFLAAAGYIVMGLVSKEDVVAQNDAAAGVQAVAQAGATETQATPEDLQRLLAEAKDANEKAQLVSPEGANAVELYLKALDIDPENRIAKDALNEIMPYAIDRADQYISEGNIPQAERALMLLRKADPSSSVILTTLAGKIENLKRIQSSRDAEQQALVLAQQQQAQQRAQEQAGTATETPAPPPVTEAPVIKPIEPVASVPKPVVATTPPPPVASPTSEDRNFQLTRKVEATYPQRALRQRIEGWVELTFIVTSDGDVSDVKVVDSQPRREFDREAMRALSQWKFKPRITNGKPVSAAARQRLEFKLGS